jgi:hypothetical protein
MNIGLPLIILATSKYDLPLDGGLASCNPNGAAFLALANLDDDPPSFLEEADPSVDHPLLTLDLVNIDAAGEWEWWHWNDCPLCL